MIQLIAGLGFVVALLIALSGLAIYLWSIPVGPLGAALLWSVPVMPFVMLACLVIFVVPHA